MIRIVVLHRVVWAVLGLCLGSTLAADSFHPHIVKSQVVTLDVAAIERHANSGTPFELVLGDTRLEVVLTPAPVWPEKGLPVLEVDEKGEIKQYVVHGNITYAGDVVGEDPDTSEARFAIKPGFLEGYVLSKAGWWFIEPLSRFDPKAGEAEFLVYATRDLDFVLEYGDDDTNADTVVDYTADQPAPRPPGIIRVAMAADLKYVCLTGDSLTYPERQAVLINKVNGIYRTQVRREFMMTLSLADFAGTFLASSNHSILLGQFNHFIGLFGGLEGLGSDIAHLTTAKNLNGDILGAAGVFTALSQQGVVRTSGTQTQMLSARMLAFQNMMTAAHEIGHNFTGSHGRADFWCATEFGICWDWEFTLMWYEFHSDNKPRFSDGTITEFTNNKKRVRENMAARGFAELP